MNLQKKTWTHGLTLRCVCPLMKPASSCPWVDNFNPSSALRVLM